MLNTLFMSIDPIARELAVLMARSTGSRTSLAAEIGSYSEEQGFTPGFTVHDLNTISLRLSNQEWTSKRSWHIQQCFDWEDDGVRLDEKKSRSLKRRRTHEPIRRTVKKWRTSLEFLDDDKPLLSMAQHEPPVYRLHGAQSLKHAQTPGGCILFALVEREIPQPTKSHNEESCDEKIRKVRRLSCTKADELPELVKPSLAKIRMVQRFEKSASDGGFFVELAIEWCGESFSEAEHAAFNEYAHAYRVKIVWPDVAKFRAEHSEELDKAVSKVLYLVRQVLPINPTKIVSFEV